MNMVNWESDRGAISHPCPNLNEDKLGHDEYSVSVLHGNT